MKCLKSQEMRKLAPELDPLRIGTGWKPEELAMPQVIIESTAGDSHPGSGHLHIIVDEVKEVVTLCTDEIDKTSGSKDGKAMFINGVGKHGDELISLFEISSIVEEKENA